MTKFNPPVEFCIAKSLVSAVGSASCVKVPFMLAFPMLSMTNKLAPALSWTIKPPAALKSTVPADLTCKFTLFSPGMVSAQVEFTLIG